MLGQKWKWLFTYPNGVVDDNLHVPPDEPVRLVMTSQDVIHSFYVPDFRIKRDVLPGRYERSGSRRWRPATYQIYCAEYCGTTHSGMLAQVIVHRNAARLREVARGRGELHRQAPPEKLWEGGQKLYNQRGCKQCHSIDGARRHRPVVQGDLGSRAGACRRGQATVEENYVRESILNPQAKVVAGFEPVMPTYQGRLKDKEITAIIAYLKTLE